MYDVVKTKKMAIESQQHGQPEFSEPAHFDIFVFNYTGFHIAVSQRVNIINLGCQVLGKFPAQLKSPQNTKKT